MSSLGNHVWQSKKWSSKRQGPGESAICITPTCQVFNTKYIFCLNVYNVYNQFQLFYNFPLLTV